jgi:hypothetical protein
VCGRWASMHVRQLERQLHVPDLWRLGPDLLHLNHRRQDLQGRSCDVRHLFIEQRHLRPVRRRGWSLLC